jgi:hypothetical protein
MPPCLQGQHEPSGQVSVAWRFDAPDSTTMLTPRRSSSLAASTQLTCLHDDFDAVLSDGVSPQGGLRDMGLRRHPRRRLRRCAVTWAHLCRMPVARDGQVTRG